MRRKVNDLRERRKERKAGRSRQEIQRAEEKEMGRHVMIQQYLDVIEKEIINRAIEIFDAEVEHAQKSVEAFEAATPSLEIPRIGNLLDPAYCVRVRGIISGQPGPSDQIQENIAKNQITKAIDERRKKEGTK